MKLYAGSSIPIRTKPDQYNTFYGTIIGFDLEKSVVIVKHRDNKVDTREYTVAPKSDAKGTWWEVVT